jgi:hypothetical protein
MANFFDGLTAERAANAAALEAAKVELAKANTVNQQLMAPA